MFEVFLTGVYTAFSQTACTVPLFWCDLTCSIPWESFNTSRLSKQSLLLFSMIRVAVGRLSSIKRKKKKLSALQRFPSDVADRKSTQITAEAVGEIKSWHLQYMHLPEVFPMFTYSRADTAVNIHIAFFNQSESVGTLNLGSVNTEIPLTVQRIMCPVCSNLDYIPVRMWERCYQKQNNQFTQAVPQICFMASASYSFQVRVYSDTLVKISTQLQADAHD